MLSFACGTCAPGDRPHPLMPSMIVARGGVSKAAGEAARRLPRPMHEPEQRRVVLPRGGRELLKDDAIVLGRDDELRPRLESEAVADVLRDDDLALRRHADD